MKLIAMPQIAACGIGLLGASAALAGGSMDKYFTNPEHTPRYYIAPEEGPLIGNQKLLLLAPEMLKPGQISMRLKKSSNASESGFDLDTPSEWGDLKFRIEPVTPADGAKLAALKDKVAASKLQLLGGTITKVEDGGKRFTADLDDGVSATFTLLEREAKSKKTKGVLPDIASRQYGPNAQHQFDLYYPKDRGTEPLPVIIFVHGGGWGALDKVEGAARSKNWTGLGFAFVSVNYRFVGANNEWPAMNPPVAASMFDAARCVQYLRYHAKDLGLDMSRVGMTGGSAGGATTCWIAMHDDMADPESDDPIARESTRLTIAIPQQAQTSIDPVQMREWIPGINYGPHAFFAREERGEKGAAAFDFWLSKRDDILPWIKEFSAYEHASADDPPMLLNYVGQTMANPPTDNGNATHSPLFGKHLHARLKELGVEVWFWADNVDCENPRYQGKKGDQNFAVDHLLKAQP